MLYARFFAKFYPEKAFGGDFGPRRTIPTPEVQCLIISGGMVDCWDDPERHQGRSGLTKGHRCTGPRGFNKGWILWPPIPLQLYSTIVNTGGVGAIGKPSDAELAGHR